MVSNGLCVELSGDETSTEWRDIPPARGYCHGAACAVDESRECMEGGSRTIAFNVSSHGFMEMDGCSDVLGPCGEPAGRPR